jgi:hypothetical protein
MNTFITIKPDEKVDSGEYPFIDLRNTEKQKGRNLSFATKYFISSYFYEIFPAIDSKEPAYLEVERPTGTADMFLIGKEKFFFKKLEYVGYSPNGYHVFKGLPFEDHRNLKGVPRSKKFLFVHIEPKNDKFKLRYAQKQHAATQ